jgi:molybdate transport system permease protein
VGTGGSFRREATLSPNGAGELSLQGLAPVPSRGGSGTGLPFELEPGTPQLQKLPALLSEKESTGAVPHSWPRARRTRRLPGLGTWLLLSTAGLFILLLGLPVAAIFARVLPNEALLQTLGRPVVLEALRLSAQTTTLTLALVLALGTPLAWLLARRRLPGQALVEGLVELPMVLPPAVAGIGLLMAFGRRGLLGPPLESAGLSVGFTTAAVVLAQLFVAAPFYVRAARAGFLGVDRDLEEVARTYGASDFETFWRVTVPLSLPSLLAGASMCWARALGEFGATIMFAGSFQGRTQTMPLAIYAALESDLDAALALSALLTIVAFGLLVVLRLTVGRRERDLT